MPTRRVWLLLACMAALLLTPMNAHGDAAGDAPKLFSFFLDGREGVMDTEGRIVLPATCTTASVLEFADGSIRIAADGGIRDRKRGENGENIDLALFDETGTPLTEYGYEALYMTERKSALFYLRDGKTGLMDIAGREITGPLYMQMEDVGQGVFIGIEGNFYDGKPANVYRVDMSGKRKLLVEKAREVGYTGNGLLAVKNAKGLYGYYDLAGKAVIKPQFDYAETFCRGFAVVGKDGLRGLIDVQGNFVIPMRYGDLYTNYQYPNGDEVPEENMRVFTSDQPNSYMAAERDFVVFSLYPVREVAQMRALDLYGLSNGMLDAHYSDRRAIYDAQGAEIMRFHPDVSVSFVFGDYLLINDYSKAMDSTFTAYLVDNTGKRVTEEYHSLFDEIVPGTERHVLQCLRQTSSTGRGNASMRYGYIGADLKILLPPVYDYASIISDNRFWVTEGPLSGIVDGEGNWLYQYSEYMKLVD